MALGAAPSAMAQEAGLWDRWGLPATSRMPEACAVCSNNVLPWHCAREATTIEPNQGLDRACLSNAPATAGICVVN